jgi:hypothetical protein
MTARASFSPIPALLNLSLISAISSDTTVSHPPK